LAAKKSAKGGQGMIDFLKIGYFDHSALEQSKIVVHRPLEKQVVCGLLEGMGEFAPSDDGFAFWWINDGYLLCVSPLVKPIVVNFIVSLLQTTGCEVLHDPTMTVFTTEGFLAHCHWLSGLQHEIKSPGA
jgi:hypothetical protein